MRTVNIAELKDRLSTYVKFAKAGETVVIRDRNLPVAKLVPYVPEDVSEEDLALVASGAMRLPQSPVDWDAFSRLPLPKLRKGAGPSALTQALLDEREESR